MRRVPLSAAVLLSLLSLHCVAPEPTAKSEPAEPKDASTSEKMPASEAPDASAVAAKGSGPAEEPVDAGASGDGSAKDAAVDPNAKHAVWLEVEGLHAPGLQLALTPWGAHRDYTVAFPENGRFLLYSFSPGELLLGVQLTTFPAAPYERCTSDIPSNGAVANHSDVTLHIRCADRFASVATYTPSSALPFAMAGEPSNLAALDVGFTFAASSLVPGMIDGTSALVAFDPQGHVTASDTLPFYVLSLAPLSDTGLAYVAGVDPQESHLETQSAFGAPTNDGGNLDYTRGASANPEGGIGYVFQPTDVDGDFLTPVAPGGSAIDDGVTTSGGFSYVEQGAAFAITAASFSGDGLDVSVWSASPFVITRMVHLSGLEKSSARPNTLTYAGGKVWVASVDASGITWRSYDVIW